tara:strand:- start:17108 stop:22438 length:5331 start_codon:yes stop_codon:yes gene_type:complete
MSIWGNKPSSESFPFIEIDDWQYKDECHPYTDGEGFLYIVVESEYLSPGNDKENRLAEARRYGVEKLLQFYGKMQDEATVDQLDSVAETPDYLVNYRPCGNMIVLVRVPVETFEAIADDDTECDVAQRLPNQVSAFLSVENYRQQIEYVVNVVESFIPFIAASDQFITNINIIKEMRRLRRTADVIERYFNLNNISASNTTECPPNLEDVLEIVYSVEYDVMFALIEGKQYTIGYNCFVENPLLNHLTTAHLLANLGAMEGELIYAYNDSFNIFDFLEKYLLPTPIIMPKEKATDGLAKYDENGLPLSLADIAKIITLDLDVNLCPTEEERLQRERVILSPVTRASIARAATQAEEFVGDNKLSSKGVQDLVEQMSAIKGSFTSKQGAEEALDQLYNNTMAKINIGCVLNETLQCLLEKSITLLGEELFDDPDLEKIINIRKGTLGQFVDGECNLKKCDGTPMINADIGFPVFQGITIPDNFPTLNFLGSTFENALEQLYLELINALSSLVLGVLQNSCELLYKTATEGIDVSYGMLEDNLQDWISKSIGVNYEDLNDPEAWSDALQKSGGTGFLGTVGNYVSRMEDSFESVISGTGISMNLPIPDPNNAWNFNTEEVFISPQVLSQFFSDTKDAAENVQSILSPAESRDVYKGIANDETLTLMYKCVNKANPSFGALFKNKHEMGDLFSGLGKLVDNEFLDSPLPLATTVPTDLCNITNSDSAATIREILLSEKDDELTTEEINEILDKEKKRTKQKLIQTFEILELYQNGNIISGFPKLYGGEGALIPEAPPIISNIIKNSVDGLFGSAISDFSTNIANYQDYWFEDPELGLPKIKFVSVQTTPTTVYYNEDGKLLGYDFADAYLSKDGPIYEIIKYVKDTPTQEGTTAYVYSYPAKFRVSPFRALYKNTINPLTSGQNSERILLDDQLKNISFFSKAELNKRPTQTSEYEENAVKYDTTDYDIGNKTNTLGQTSFRNQYEYKKEYNFEINYPFRWLSEYGLNREEIGNADIFKQIIRNSLNKYFTYSQDATHIDAIVDALGVSTINENMWLGSSNYANLLQNILKRSIEHVAPLGEYRAPSSRGTPEWSIQRDNATAWNTKLGEIDLTYNSSDIFGYNTLKQQSADFLNNILNIDKAVFCDPLTPLNRTGVTYAIKMLIRSFFVEQSYTTVQVFNAFDVSSYGESQLFIDYLYSKMEIYLDKVYANFETLDGRLWQALLDECQNIYDIRIALGEELPTVNSSEGIFKYFIQEELIEIHANIENAIDTLYPDYETFNHFIIDKLFPSLAASTNAVEQKYEASIPSKQSGTFTQNVVVGTPDFRSGKMLPPDASDAWFEALANTSDIIEKPKWEDVNFSFPAYFDESHKEQMKQDFEEIINTYWDALREARESASNNTADDIYPEIPQDLRDLNRKTFDKNTLEQVVIDDSKDIQETKISSYQFENVGFGEESYQYPNVATVTIGINFNIDITADVQVEYDATSEYLAGQEDSPIYNSFEIYNRVSDDPDSVEKEGTIDIQDSEVEINVGGPLIESYVEYKKKGGDTNVMGVNAFVREQLSNEKLDAKFKDVYEYIIFGRRVCLISEPSFSDTTANSTPSQRKTGTVKDEVGKLTNVTSVSEKYKVFEMKKQERRINGRQTAYDYISIPLVSVECEYSPSDLTSDTTIEQVLKTFEDEYHQKVKNDLKARLFETDEFKLLFEHLFPMRDIVSLLSIFEDAYLSDSDLRPKTAASPIQQIMDDTKLSILQVFVASLYGNGKISYPDPFIEKAGGFL